MTNSHECIHEDQLQGISRKTAELETRADYKDKRIDELNIKIDKMDEKLDKVLEGFNEFKIQSNKDDKELDKRLTAIETKQDLQEKTTKDNREEVKLWIAIITVIFLALTFYFNFIH
jgi:uncharacterized coiled-coil protein SlyX